MDGARLARWMREIPPHRLQGPAGTRRSMQRHKQQRAASRGGKAGCRPSPNPHRLAGVCYRLRDLRGWGRVTEHRSREITATSTLDISVSANFCQLVPQDQPSHSMPSDRGPHGRPPGNRCHQMASQSRENSVEGRLPAPLPWFRSSSPKPTPEWTDERPFASNDVQIKERDAPF